MAEELRLALILLGALAIGSVILHGIWTVRRTVNAERKAEKEAEKDLEPEIAPEDQEIEELKLKQIPLDFTTLEGMSNLKKGQGIPLVDVNVDSIYHNEEQLPVAEVNEEVSVDEQSNMFVEDDLNIEDDLPHISTIDIEDEQEATIDFNSVDADEDTPEIGLSATEGQSISNTPNVETPIKQNEPALEPEKQEVFMLFVDKSEGLPIDGAKLLPTLLTLGFKYGEMSLFHRHQNNSGQGDVLFSLANMFNPGTFDIDAMEQLTTRGLTIFMTLPNAGDPLQTFNMMHNAAKKIAKEFNAVVLDDKRRPLDVSNVQSYVERIRNF